MDKNTIETYPGRQAEHDHRPLPADTLEPEEQRLNVSREAIRQRLSLSQTERAQNKAAVEENDTDLDRPIDTWSSLLLSLVAPAAKKTAAQHPYTLLMGSALVGAYLGWSRPFRKLIGSVIVGVLVRNVVATSINVGSRNGGRILRNYLNRQPQKKYPAYQKQDHSQVNI